LVELSLYKDDLKEDDENLEDALEVLDSYVGKGTYDVLEDSPDNAPLSGEAPYLEVESGLGETVHSYEDIEQSLKSLGFTDGSGPGP